MKFAAIALCVGLAGTLLVSNLQGATIVPGEGLAATVLIDGVTTGSIRPATPVAAKSDAIRLIDLRSGATCKVAKPDTSNHVFALAPIGPDCAGSEELSRIALWRSTPDGALIMADRGGDTVLRFAPGDGVLYESVYPETALITIVPAKG